MVIVDRRPELRRPNTGRWAKKDELGLLPSRGLILSVILRLHAKRGEYPSIRDIGAESGMANATIHASLNDLERVGLIKRHSENRFIIWAGQKKTA